MNYQTDSGRGEVIFHQRAESIFTTISPLDSIHDVETKPSLHPFPGEEEAASAVNATLTYPAPTSFSLRPEEWAIPLVILAVLEMCAIVAFEAYVLYNVLLQGACRRRLYLGQTLLFGNFLLATVAMFYGSEMNTLFCIAVRFGTGLAYSLIFATMLVKSVVLLSIQAGIYLPGTYQALLMLFTMMPQFVLGLQWLLTRPPLVSVRELPSSRTVLVCTASYREILCSLAYVMFLLAFLACLSIRTRSPPKDTQNEVWWLGVTVGFCILIWVMWTLMGAALGNTYTEACIGYGMLAIGLVVFVMSALPNDRTYRSTSLQDLMSLRWEEGSVSSYAPSLYSPSFFHYRPQKGAGMPRDSLASRRRDRAGRTYELDLLHRLNEKATRGVGPVAEGFNGHHHGHHPRNERGSRNHHATHPTTSYPSHRNPDVFYMRNGMWTSPGMMY